MTKRNSVLIATSLDAPGLARLPEMFAKGAVEVTVATGDGFAISSSRFVSHRIRTGRSPEEVRQGLEDHLGLLPTRYDRVVIADEPLIRTFLDRPAAPALAVLAPMLADSARLARTMSKISFTIDAGHIGIPVPAFKVLAGLDDLNESCWPTRPFVAKGEESMSGSGVRVIHTAADLQQAKMSLGAGPILVQEFVPGRVGATSALFSKGKPLCWCSFYLRDNWPNALAAASTLEFCWRPQAEIMLNQLGSLTGFDGLCGVDWVIDPKTNNMLVLEMNMRPTPGLHLAHRVGVSFSSALSSWVRGEDRTQKPVEKPSQSCRMFPQHLFRAIDHRDPLGFLLTFQSAPWQDPALLVAQTRRVLTHYAPKSLRASMRSAMGR